MFVADFRTFIREAFQRRHLQEPSLSLGEFARELGMSPQKMNSILNQNAGLSTEAAIALAQKLQLSGRNHELFVALVDSVHHRSAIARQSALERVQALSITEQFEELSESEFLAISQWYEMAACMLTDVADFKSDPEWIAARLGISIEEARTAVDKFFELGLFRQEHGRWVRDSEKFNIEFSKPNPKARDYHRQMALRGADFLERNPDEQRHFASAVVSVTPGDMEFIREQVDIFHKDLLSKIAERGGVSERVWSLNIQCFPLDRTEKNS